MSLLTEAELIKAISAAASLRDALKASFEAFRLVDGIGDKLPGLYIDKFASVLLIHLLLPTKEENARAREVLLAIAPKIAERLSVKTVLLRVHDLDPKKTSTSDAEQIFGRLEPPLIIEEDGVRFLVNPISQVNAGLFLDMREVRGLVRKLALRKRILNTFCFTGSLGCAALAGGAAEVVQVDISKKIIGWAKDNFELNGELCPQAKMRFIIEDTESFLEREVRRLARGAQGYDLLIIDAPAFGSSSGTVFSFNEDIDQILNLALQLIKSPGQLILSTNKRDVSTQELKSIVSEKAQSLNREIITVGALPLGIDFRSDPLDSPLVRGVIAELS